MSRDGSVRLTRSALDQSRISATSVKDIAAGLVTKAIGQNVVIRRTGRTACVATEQTAKDRTGNDAHGITTLSLRRRARSSLNRTSDATNGGGSGLRATSKDDECRRATPAR